MSRHHPAAHFFTGALGACLALLAFGPGTTDAGPEEATPPAARAGPVTFETELVDEGQHAVIRIRARNADRLEQGCRVQAAVLRERGNPMSRVMAAPERLWSDAVALRVPARGEVVRSFPLPAAATKAAGAPARRVDLGQVRVFLEPECSARVEVG